MFLDIAAQMNGFPINYSKSAKNCHVASSTIAEYYQILEDTMIAFRLNAWDRSVRHQVRKSPKFYFFDNGVLNALRGELGLALKRSSFRFGSLFEVI
jgi:predicted AAA+ superfamily ATPase